MFIKLIERNQAFAKFDANTWSRLRWQKTGMYAALLAFLNKGDEVICIEPFFDQYLASIIFNGGKPVYVPLHPPEAPEDGSFVKRTGADWKLDLKEFE